MRRFTEGGRHGHLDVQAAPIGGASETDVLASLIDTDRLAPFIVTSLLVVVVPGPGVLFIVGRGISLGRRAALATVFGHFLGVMTQLAAVAAGIGAVVERSLVVFTIVKLVGAVYLIALGIQAFRHRHRLVAAVDATHPQVRLARISRDGYIVGVSNPKGFALFASVLPQFVDRQLGHVPLQIAVLGLFVGGIGLVSDSSWGLLAGTARTWLARSPRRLATVGGAGGLATIGLGIRLAATGRHQ